MSAVGELEIDIEIVSIPLADIKPIEFEYTVHHHAFAQGKMPYW